MSKPNHAATHSATSGFQGMRPTYVDSVVGTSAVDKCGIGFVLGTNAPKTAAVTLKIPPTDPHPRGTPQNCWMGPTVLPALCFGRTIASFEIPE